MKRIKRVFAAVSAAAMCTGMLAEVPYCTTNNANGLLVYAAGEEQQTSGVCGESLTWTLDSDGVLIISGSGDMTNWTESPKVPWYVHREIIKRITIADGFTSIGKFAFCSLRNAESVKIPESVTAIGGGAFAMCSKLPDIKLHAGISEIGSTAFRLCTGMKAITVENPECVIGDSAETFPAKAVIHGYSNSTAQAYAEKYEREFVALDDKKTPVEIVDSGECGAEGNNATWTLNNNGTLTISGSGEMDSWALNSPWEEYADEITKVIIEDGITTIGEQAFNSFKKLVDVSIPDSVTNIKTGAFYECLGLTSITIPESVTEMGHSVFYGCSSLKEITIPDGIDTINSGMFRECTNLTTITFSKNVEKVDYAALCGCTNLKSVVFENPECKIADAEYTICNSHDFDTKENVFNGTIYGYSNSTAQVYAEKYNRKFAVLSGEAENLSFGDINSDGVVDSSDASLILVEYAVSLTGGTSTFTAEQKKAADTNCDSICDASDASLVLAYYSYISTGGKGSIEEFIADKNK